MTTGTRPLSRLALCSLFGLAVFVVAGVTGLALAPTAVMFPPKPAPMASAHHIACTWPGLGTVVARSATTGVMVATYGMLSMRPESTPETTSITIEAKTGSPPLTSFSPVVRRYAHMGRPERPLDPAAGPVQRLAPELRELRRDAGNPSHRRVAGGAGGSAAPVSRAVSL